MEAVLIRLRSRGSAPKVTKRIPKLTKVSLTLGWKEIASSPGATPCNCGRSFNAYRFGFAMMASSFKSRISAAARHTQ